MHLARECIRLATLICADKTCPCINAGAQQLPAVTRRQAATMTDVRRVSLSTVAAIMLAVQAPGAICFSTSPLMPGAPSTTTRPSYRATTPPKASVKARERQAQRGSGAWCREHGGVVLRALEPTAATETREEPDEIDLDIGTQVTTDHRLNSMHAYTAVVCAVHSTLAT